MFSFYSLLNEAEDDENTTPTDTPDDNGDDETFDIDTDLGDEDDSSSDDTGAESEDDSIDGGGDSGEDDTSDDGSMSDDNEDAVPEDGEIMPQLTAEEQAIKIRELKKLYNDLYISLDEISNRLNDILNNESNSEVLNRIGGVLYDLKVYMAEYITKQFATKSYYENDTMFVRFLSATDTVKRIVENLANSMEKEMQ